MSADSVVRKRKPNPQNPPSQEEEDLPHNIKGVPTKTPSDGIFLDLIILLCILFFASLKLFNNIEIPQSVVWDETHFTKFSTW